MIEMRRMETKMMEMPSQTDFHSKKNKETALERSAVAPMATQRMFWTAYIMDSIILA